MPAAVDGLKKCNKCGHVKPVAEFSKNRRPPDGFCWKCKVCDRQRCRERYSANRGAYVAQKQKYIESLPAAVYKILCNPTGKVYIGQSKHYPRRFTEHKRELLQKKHANSTLQADYIKYGIDAFEFSIIQEYPCNTPSKILEEQEDIEILKHIRMGSALYNVAAPEDSDYVFEEIELTDEEFNTLIAMCKKADKTPTQLLKERINMNTLKTT